MLSKKNDYASYVKTTLKVFRITVYFLGFMKVILSNLQPLTEDEKMCATMSVDNGSRIRGLQRYIATEVALFFGYVIALLLYVIWAKTFVLLKEKFTPLVILNDMDESDPFWQLAKFSENDFMLQDNFIIMTVST